jgi:hypothetical protein
MVHGCFDVTDVERHRLADQAQRIQRVVEKAGDITTGGEVPNAEPSSRVRDRRGPAPYDTAPGTGELHGGADQRSSRNAVEHNPGQHSSRLPGRARLLRAGNRRGEKDEGEGAHRQA